MPPCCYATLTCVHMVQTTLPRLRACANYHTHLPLIKRPLREQLLGYQVGDADDETTLQRGALDVAAKFMKLTFRRGVLVRRQQRRRPTSPANTLRRLRTRFAGVTEIPPPPIISSLTSPCPPSAPPTVPLQPIAVSADNLIRCTGRYCNRCNTTLGGATALGGYTPCATANRATQLKHR